MTKSLNATRTKFNPVTDRELALLLAILMLVIAFVVVVAFPRTKTVTHVVTIREQVTLTSVLKFLSAQPSLGEAEAQTSYGRASCVSYPPLIDGRSLIAYCALYTPVAPFSSPSRTK